MITTLDPYRFAEIVSLLITKNDAFTFLATLDRFVDGLYKKDTSAEAFLDKEMAFGLRNVLLKQLAQESVALGNVKDVRKFVQDLKDSIKAIEVVTISMAIEANELEVKKIGAWFTSNKKEKVLLNFVKDVSLVGGSIIAFNGLLKDYTLKKVLQEKFKKKELRTFLK